MPNPAQDAPVLVQVCDMYKSFQHGSRKLDVLRGVNLNPGQEADDMVSLRLWLEDL